MDVGPSLARVRVRRLVASLAVLAFAVAVATSTAGGASSSVTVSLDVASWTQVTNGCRTAAATSIGSLQPNVPATSSTTAPCTVSFSGNQTTTLRMAMADGVAPALTSTGAPWKTGLSATGNRINGMAAYDSNRIVATSTGGRVLRSADGGATWVNHAAIPSGHWGYDAEFVPGSPDRVVVSGGGGSVISTTNAMSSLPSAATWTDHTPAVHAALVSAGLSTSRDVMGVAIKDAVTWVIGGAGFAGVTTDGGATFTAYALSPSWLAYTDVDWVIADEFVASTSEGSLHRTTTGAATAASWASHAPSNNDRQYLTDLAVGNATNVYAVARTGAVFRWDGAAFQAMTIPGSRAHRAYSVAAVPGTPATVTVGGQLGITWRSTDAGSTWSTQPTPLAAGWYAAATPTATQTIVAGTAETIAASADSGSSWTTQRVASRRPLLGIDADPVDGRRATAVGEGGLVRRTTDGGATWLAEQYAGSTTLRDVEYWSSSVAWAVGVAGSIRRSGDGGATWSGQVSPVSGDLNAVSTVTDRTAWVVGDAGTVLRTTDAGATWISRPAGTSKSLLDVVGLSGSTAVAVGPGRFLRTTDSGLTWATPTGLPTGVPWVGIVSGGAASLVAVSLHGHVYRSADDGASWTSVASVGNDNARVDGNGTTIGMVTGYDRFRSSGDVGSTWKHQGMGQGWGASGVAVVDRHTAYATFDDGRIVDIEETSSATMRFSDYATGSTFGTDGTTSTFGFCIQSAPSVTLATGRVTDSDGTCTASDGDPWSAVPATASSLGSTSGAGATGTVDIVWGMRARSDQAPGSYSAGIVFEAVAAGA